MPTAIRTSARACQAFVDGLKAKDAETRIGTMLLAGEQASEATTAAIRASADDLLPGHWSAKPDELREACEAEGIDVPAVEPVE